MASRHERSAPSRGIPPRASPEAGRARAPTSLVVALAVAATAALRLAYVASLRPTPWFTFLNVDPAFYDRWAVEIAGGDWLGARAFYMDPLYPYLLGALYRLLGHGLLLPRLVNVVLSAASCWLVARIARSLAGPWSAVAAAGAFAVYGPDVFHTGEIDKTSLSVFLVAAALALLLRPGRRAKAAAGAMLGLAALTRANVLACAAAAALLLIVDPETPAPRRRRLGDAACLVGALVATLAPVAVRNWWVSGELVLTTAQAGQNFYIGNCPENPQGAYGQLPFVRGAPPFEELDFRAEAERRAGRPLRATDVSRFWFGEALRHLRDHPRTALGVTAQKVALFWNDFEVPDSTDQYLAARYSWVMRLPLLGFGTILPLAAIGAVAACRARGGRLLVAFAAVYTLTTAAFFIMARYRIQIVTVVLPLAALGAQRMVAWARQRRWGLLAAGLAGAAGAAAFSSHPIDVFTEDNEMFAQTRLHHLGMIYLQAGDPGAALRIHLEAVDTCWQFCRTALDDLLAFYAGSGQQAEAIRVLQAFLAARPGHPIATEHLARLQAEAP